MKPMEIIGAGAGHYEVYFHQLLWFDYSVKRDGIMVTSHFKTKDELAEFLYHVGKENVFVINHGTYYVKQEK